MTEDNLRNFVQRGQQAQRAVNDLLKADDATITEALARELATLGPMEVVLRPESVLQMVGLVQLAKRHPGIANSPNVVATGDRFVEGAREYFAACPAVLEVIRRGEDPAQDRPW